MVVVCLYPLIRDKQIKVDKTINNKNNKMYLIVNECIAQEWQLVMNYSYDRESNIYNRNGYYTSSK